MNLDKHLPDTVSARLDARLAPFATAQTHGPGRRGRLVNELKLMFAALGAGSAAVPMGDNGRTTRQLAEYAASLS